MLDIYNNKTSFMKLRPRKKTLVFILIIILTLSFLLYLLITTKIYDNYQTKGYIICEQECLLTTYIPSNISFNKISFNDKIYSYKIISIYLDEENFNSFLKLTINVAHNFLDKEIVNLNIYYNKESIFTKLKKRMF